MLTPPFHSLLYIESPPPKGWYRRVENNGWRPLADRILFVDLAPGGVFGDFLQPHALQDSKHLNRVQYAPLRVMRK
jgi:hypothetical protein